MINKKISLVDITKLLDNEEISEKYVKYICGLAKAATYRHAEIIAIHNLITHLNVSKDDLNGFIYDYVVPQLNKEFDLIKIGENTCINIELKSEIVSETKIKKQLLQNQYYLKMLGKTNLYLFTYISETNTIYSLKNTDLHKSEFSALELVIDGLTSVEVDLDFVFSAKNILVSPLNSPQRFLKEDYILTENQQNIKNKMLTYIKSENTAKFIGLTGGPGTGKTLLIYDLAKKLGENQRVLLIHSGILCEGHMYLNRYLLNIKIISAKELRMREINDVDIVIVDESHRLYEDSLEKIERWIIKSNATCVFSYDVAQKLSRAENRSKTSDAIDNLCLNNKYILKNKIRTNKELALFITCLLDLSKYRDDYNFKNVQVYYEENLESAICLAKNMKDFTFIGYTPSIYGSPLDLQRVQNNTHNVIGQEFDNVCMILDNNFYYDANKLCGVTHPNPDYIFTKLLFQGLTRVRSQLAIIITSENLLNRILEMF